MEMNDYGALAASSAMILIATFCVYIGSKRSASKQDGNKEEIETITEKNAMMVPLFASISLLSLYIVLKLVSQEYVNMILSIYFNFIGMLVIGNVISPSLKPLFNEKWSSGLYCLKFTSPFEQNEKKEKESCSNNEVFSLEFSRVEVVGVLVGLLSAIGTIYTDHWCLKNFMAICLAINAIELISLDTFKNACIMMSGLLIYDVFWVFKTDVMVDVATKIDGPIKILFPKNIFETLLSNDTKFNLLGLGDIVVPGIVVALLLRFDLKRFEGKITPYFNASIVAFFSGLVLTNFVMRYFNKAQPALLYLVPFGLAAPLLLALSRGEMKELFEYQEVEEEVSDESEENKKSK